MRKVIVLLCTMLGVLSNAFSETSYHFQGTDYKLRQDVNLSEVKYSLVFSMEGNTSKKIELRNSAGIVIGTGDDGQKVDNDCIQHCNFESGNGLGLIMCWGKCWIFGPKIDLDLEKLTHLESINLGQNIYRGYSSGNLSNAYGKIDIFDGENLVNRMVIGINSEEAKVNFIGMNLGEEGKPSFGCDECHKCPTIAGTLMCYLMCLGIMPMDNGVQSFSQN